MIATQAKQQIRQVLQNATNVGRECTSLTLECQRACNATEGDLQIVRVSRIARHAMSVKRQIRQVLRNATSVGRECTSPTLACQRAWNATEDSMQMVRLDRIVTPVQRVNTNKRMVRHSASLVIQDVFLRKVRQQNAPRVRPDNIKIKLVKIFAKIATQARQQIRQVLRNATNVGMECTSPTLECQRACSATEGDLQIVRVSRIVRHAMPVKPQIRHVLRNATNVGRECTSLTLACQRA